MRYQCTKSLEKQLKFVYKYIIYENHLSFEKNNVGIEGWNSSDHLETMRRMSGSFLTVERETHSADALLVRVRRGSGRGTSLGPERGRRASLNSRREKH